MFEGYFGSTNRTEDSKSCFDMVETILDDMFGAALILKCCSNKCGDFEIKFYPADSADSSTKSIHFTHAKVMRFTPEKLEEIYNERYRK